MGVLRQTPPADAVAADLKDDDEVVGCRGWVKERVKANAEVGALGDWLPCAVRLIKPRPSKDLAGLKAEPAGDVYKVEESLLLKL